MLDLIRPRIQRETKALRVDLSSTLDGRASMTSNVNKVDGHEH